ncbi:MAG: hypothetical protein KBC17_02410 [Candidatus Pacebacteria bacterium]|nr:hypothetical protein [Candidatus Paceibacterota bacterium]
MTRLIKALIPRPFSQKEFYIAVVVIVLLVSVIPYLEISGASYVFYKLTNEHAMAQSIVYPIRRFVLISIGLVCLLNHMKVWLFSHQIIKNKIIEGIYDRLMFFPTWGAFIAFLVLSINAIFSMQLLEFFAPRWQYTLIFSDMVIYVLSVASIWIFGAVVHTVGKLDKEADMWLSTHFSSLEYFLWPYLLGIILAKILLGKNLMKYKLLSWYFDKKGIVVDRTTKKGRAQAILDMREARANGYGLLAGSDGRSYDDTPKPFTAGLVKDIEVGMSVGLIVIVNSGQFKRPLKGSISKKPGKNVRILVKSWWNPVWLFKALLLPWANSPRIINVVFTKKIVRTEEETTEEYCERLNRIVLETKAKEESRLLHRPRKIKFFLWTRWNYRRFVNFCFN